MEGVIGIALGVSIIFLAGLTQGLTSFGFALISVPFLSILLPIPEVVPIVVILSLGTNLIMMRDSFKEVDFRKIGILVASSLVAAPVGALALTQVHPNLIKTTAGVVILVASGLLLLGRSFPVKSERLAFVPVGLLSGFLNGSVSMSGPPVALFLSNQGTKKEEFRANITLYAIILNFFTLIAFLSGGLVTGSTVAKCLWLIPSMIVGVLIGSRIVSRVNQDRFKKVVLVLLLLSGVWTLATAFP